MARGWESKSVEEQQSQSRESSTPSHPFLSAEQAALHRKREGLLLSRKQVVGQLRSATHPLRRQMLEAALADLDRLLANLA